MDAMKHAFLCPDDEFTPIPFWFWNDELTEEELRRQIHDFRRKGVMGFVIHPRKGLPKTIPYLSDRYMHFVRFAVDEAARLGMRVVLYDEAMYPSGSAHGMVAAEDPSWASRCLTMETCSADVPAGADVVAVCAARVEDGHAADIVHLAPTNGCYALPSDGRQLLVFRMGFSGGTIRGVHENEDDGEPGAPASADLLNPAAVQAFIRLTHERYFSVLQEHFGKTVIAIFTDEPDIVGRNARPGCHAWTEGFLADFGSAADLPALWLNVGAETERIRRRYRCAVNRRMKQTYYGQLAAWCEAHGIALTGHPAKSWDIGLLQPFQLPGQDLVWRFIGPGHGVTGDDSVLGKCSADAARLLGRRRNANECFGCCGPQGVQWAFSMDDMKWYMDYLFVRGVNLLYPHAFFYSLRDGRGAERPPDVGPNNLWWPMYGQIAQYIKRLSWLLTDSASQARAAVLCEEDRLPWRSCVPLYENQIEFHYLERSFLPTHGRLYDSILSGDTPVETLPRDVVISPAAPDLRVSHVVKGGLDFYLLVNEGETAIHGLMHTAAQGRAEWWNAWTGETRSAACDAQGRFALHLPRRESIILCIDPEQPPCIAPQEAPKPPAATHAPVNASWRLTRMDNGETARLTAGATGCLPGWETLWPDYSGWVAYETDLTLVQPALLDLGQVSAMLRFCCNGGMMTEKLWGPFAFPLSAGEQHLHIEVCNTLANRLEGKALPSGIMGPVSIRTSIDQGRRSQ